jgi:hypothetical protein
VYDSREYSVPKSPNCVRLAMGTPQSGISAHRDRAAVNHRGPNTYLEWHRRTLFGAQPHLRGACPAIPHDNRQVSEQKYYGRTHLN